MPKPIRGELNFGGSLGTPPQLHGRDVQQGRRPRHDLCALQGRRAVDARPDGRPPAHAVRRAHAAACRWSSRASSGRSRSGPGALARPAGRADAARGWASPISPAIPGPASWRRRSTPQPIVDKLNATINDILRSPEAKESLAKLNVLLRPGSAAGIRHIHRQRDAGVGADGAGIRRHGAVANRRMPCLRRRRIAGSQNAQWDRRRRTEFSSCAKSLRFHLRSGHSGRESRSKVNFGASVRHG